MRCDIVFSGMIITTLVFYITGIIAAIRSMVKYKYSAWWLLIIVILPPPLAFILYAYLENTILKKGMDTKALIQSRIKVRIMVILFLIQYVFGLFLTGLLKYAIGMEWGGEISLIATNILFLLFVLTNLIYGKKMMNLLNSHI